MDMKEKNMKLIITKIKYYKMQRFKLKKNKEHLSKNMNKFSFKTNLHIKFNKIFKIINKNMAKLSQTNSTI